MRLIDGDVLIEFIENRYDITWKDDYEGGIKDACTDILEKISKMPTVDAVEVVRCRECEWYDITHPYGTVNPDAHHCKANDRFYGWDHFCGYGKGEDDD